MIRLVFTCSMPPSNETTNVRAIQSTPSEAAMILVTIAALSSLMTSLFKGLTMSVRITADREFSPELTVLQILSRTKIKLLC